MQEEMTRKRKWLRKRKINDPDQRENEGENKNEDENEIGNDSEEEN